MAKDKIVKNGYTYYIMEGVKLFLFCLMFSLMSLPGLAIPNNILALLFGLLCFAPVVVIALIMGKNCATAAYKHTRRVRADNLSDNPSMDNKQKFFAYHWAKCFIPVAVFVIPQMIALVITLIVPNIITRLIVMAPNIQFSSIIIALGHDLSVVGAYYWIFAIPMIVIPAIYACFYILTGIVQRSQYFDIADEIRRFQG